MKWTTLLLGSALGAILWLSLALLLVFLVGASAAQEVVSGEAAEAGDSPWAGHPHYHAGFFVPEPVHFGYRQPFGKGQGADSQFTGRAGLGYRLYNFFDQVDLYGSYSTRLIGEVEEISAPFAISHLPGSYLRRILTPELSIDYGWLHESNGVGGVVLEDGSVDTSSSRGWDRQFARVNYTGFLGPFRVNAQGMVFEAFNVARENQGLIDQEIDGEVLDGIRTWKGRVGLSAAALIEWPQRAVLDLGYDKNLFEGRLGVKLTQGSSSEVYTFIGYLNGKGDVILNHDVLEQVWTTGLVFVP